MASCIGSKVVAPTKVAAKPSVAVAVPKTRVSELKARTNNAATRQMLVWTPFNNKFFETLSFLPSLSADEIAKQVDYITTNGWTPCLEFAPADMAYAGDTYTSRMGPVTSGYQDNRYWTMWKLPMFGCSDSSQVLSEIAACEKVFPDTYIRLVAFDAVRQVQIISILVHRPAGATDFTTPDKRSV